MNVAVVTPYFRDPLPWLRQCHESVRAQTHPATHIMVADGAPDDTVKSWDVHHIEMPGPHRDHGDTPRAVGSVAAIGAGSDAIAYLDADNWFAPDHVQSLVELHAEMGAAVCFSHRYFCRLDGSIMGYCKDTDGETFADVSSMIFFRPAFNLVPLWAMIHPELHPICDRVMMLWIREHNLTSAFSNRLTLHYRTANQGDYRSFGEEPPPGATKTGAEFLRALKYLKRRGGPDLRLGKGVGSTSGQGRTTL